MAARAARPPWPCVIEANGRWPRRLGGRVVDTAAARPRAAGGPWRAAPPPVATVAGAAARGRVADGHGGWGGRARPPPGGSASRSHAPVSPRFCRAATPRPVVCLCVSCAVAVGVVGSAGCPAQAGYGGTRGACLVLANQSLHVDGIVTLPPCASLRPLSRLPPCPPSRRSTRAFPVFSEEQSRDLQCTAIVWGRYCIPATLDGLLAAVHVKPVMPQLSWLLFSLLAVNTWPTWLWTRLCDRGSPCAWVLA